MQTHCREWDDSASAHAAVAALGCDEIQVWLVPVACEPGARHDRVRMLCRDESERASSMRHELSRRQFVTGRAALRGMLGCHLGVDPRVLKFDFQSSGKPYLDSCRWQTDIRFNVSHSGAWVVIALARARDVGVDVEALEPFDEWRLLAGRIFSARELEALNRVPELQQLDAFYHGWTRKEAYLKATGEGLVDALAEIEVSLMPGEEPELRKLPAGGGGAHRWTLRAIPVPAGYAGALVFGSRIAGPSHCTPSNPNAFRGS
jgi:4'-phosphopantetheinyl transferase